MSLQVLYNNYGLLVFSKPVAVCSDFHFTDKVPAMETIVKKKFPDYTMLHRIDKWTSGVLVFGDNRSTIGEFSAYKWMLNQWHKKVEKSYLAIMPYPDWDKIVVDVPLADEPNQTAKPAITTFEVIQDDRDGYVLVHCTLTKSGRKHQIRKHAAHVGMPLVGDHMYGGPRVPDRNGQLLHAWRLSVDLPLPMGKTTFQAPVPEDFKKFNFDWKLIDTDANKITIID